MHKLFSILLQLAITGPSYILWQIAMSLNGRNLLNLQLASGVLRDWTRHNILGSTFGLRTLKQKLRHWMESDLTTLSAVKLSCERPIDAICIDSTQVLLVSANSGLALFDRNQLDNAMPQPQRLE
jgi:hypothetical protein